MASLFALIIWMMIQKTLTIALPSYVHVHTAAEMKETTGILLDKVDLCQKEMKLRRNDLLILIKAAPENVRQRILLRETLLSAAIKYHVPYAFVFGSSTNISQMTRLLEEDKQYGDIIIGKFGEDYFNLTLKTIFILNWTRSHCVHRWLLCVDDDVVVNFQQLLCFLEAHADDHGNKIYCNLGRGARPIRDATSKWYVSEDAWPGTVFLTIVMAWDI
jgi:hypothetical protein